MRKKDLSGPWQALLVGMQQINHGRIERLRIVRGQPLLDAPARIVRAFKAGGENGPRPEALLEDFDLKSEVVEFHDDMTRRGEVMIESLVIKHGVPFRWCIEIDLAT